MQVRVSDGEHKFLAERLGISNLSTKVREAALAAALKARQPRNKPTKPLC